MYPFSEGCFAVRNAWYVAALSHEVTREPMERWFLDEPVVLFRTEAGKAVALAGRCPHRQYPMAAGRLEGDILVCGYHGIAFAADGRCTRIPTQDRVPAAFGLRAYPLVEKWKWLWIWTGDPDKADESLIPDHAAIGLRDAPGANGELSVPLSHNHVGGRYQLLHDNLLDLSHLAFLHSSSIGMEAIATTSDEVTSGDRWLRSARHVRDADSSPWIRARYGVAKVDFVIDFTFHMPALHVGLNRTSISADAPERAGEVIRDSIVYHAVTPARRHSAHYFFATTINAPATSEEAMAPIAAGIAKVIEEDIFATEEIERMIPADRPLRDLMTAGDVAVVKGRRMLESMMKAERG
ncbi:MAG: hypothetical protein JWM38_1299 [Sphingomonas bacterium]|nr:hypothetical protein [Sphingomonas bacterium]